MGFPVGYSELPKILLHLLILLSHIRRLATWFFDLLGLDPLHSPDFAPHHLHHEFDGPDFVFPPYSSCFSLDLFNKHLPVISFAELEREFGDGAQLPGGCAVCLHEFDGPAEVRRPIGCCHVFHKGCLDRWAAHGRSTCPLCRALLVPDECYVS